MRLRRLHAAAGPGIPSYTAVCVLADKEEIGSVGISGMQSRYFETFMGDLCAGQACPCAAASSMRSACRQTSPTRSTRLCRHLRPDATTQDELRHRHLQIHRRARQSPALRRSGRGHRLCRPSFDEHDVIWQTGDLGKVDQGGGGTVAATWQTATSIPLDAGVPVLSMHAPMEIVSKLDTYMTAKGMRVFYEENSILPLLWSSKAGQRFCTMSNPARLCNRYRLALKWHQPRIVIARRPQADAAISGRHCRFALAADKNALTNCVRL